MPDLHRRKAAPQSIEAEVAKPSTIITAAMLKHLPLAHPLTAIVLITARVMRTLLQKIALIALFWHAPIDFLNRIGKVLSKFAPQFLR